MLTIFLKQNTLQNLTIKRELIDYKDVLLFLLYKVLSRKNFDTLQIAISNLNALYNFRSFRALKISAHLIKEQINAFRL